MAHQFDTALPAAQRSLIRSGAVTLLSRLLRANGGYLSAVVPWGGIVRGYTDDAGIQMLWESLNGAAPAIAIALGDCTLKSVGMGGFNFAGSLDLMAYHLSNNMRDLALGRMSMDAAALAADTTDPGLDTQLEHCRELLVGQRPVIGATVKQVVPIREEELRTENGFSLWVQHYTLTIGAQVNPNRDITQVLDEIRSSVQAAEASRLNIAAAPIGATQVAAVATYQTTANHALSPGNLVYVDGVAVAGYNGSRIVLATPTANTFTATCPSAGLAPSGGGTVSGRAVAELQNLLPP